MNKKLLAILSVCTVLSGCTAGTTTSHKVSLVNPTDNKMSCQAITAELQEMDTIIAQSGPNVATDAAVAVGGQAALHAGAAQSPYFGTAMNIFNNVRGNSQQQKAEIAQSAQQRKIVLNNLATTKNCS